ncbi:MAG: sialidase family protein [Gaiellaceae bacterium]
MVLRVLLVLALSAALADPAAAATIRGSARAELLLGTDSADRLLAGGGNDRIMAAFGGIDRLTCGGGRDLAVADLADVVPPDCETVVRRLSLDGFTNPQAQHETAVEPDSAAWGSSVVAVFQVGRFVNGASVATAFAVSRDAGRTWRRGLLPQLSSGTSPPGPADRVSDPSIAYDAVHGVWISTSLAVTGSTVAIAASRSTDGLEWDAPVEITPGPAVDKEWVACDNGRASPFRGHCYAVYSDDAGQRLLSQVSTDGGLTWAPPVRVTADLIGAQPVIRPDGTLVVIAADLGDRTGTMIAVPSTDGGASFGQAIRVGDIRWNRPERMRAAPLPSAAVDPAGTITVAWQDCRFRANCAVNDIVVSSSSDVATWSAPVRVAVDGVGSVVDHFIPGLDADPRVPGRLGLVYAFFEPGSCGRGTCRLETGFTMSRDSGATWSPHTRLDAESFPTAWIPRTDSGQMIGDYSSTSFAGSRVVPVFALAAAPLGGRFREGIFAASLPAGR